MERWRDGEMERWRDGEMERWRDGEMERERESVRASTPFGPSVGLLCLPARARLLSYRFASFETSAIVLRGTAGDGIII